MKEFKFLLKIVTLVISFLIVFSIFTSQAYAQTFNCEYLSSGQCFPEISNSIYANEHCNQFDGNRDQCESQVNITDLSDSQNPNADANLADTTETDRFRCTTNGDIRGINTAIGCVPLQPGELAAFFLSWAIGIGGGIAFLFILYSGFIIMTSAGNPERLKGGKELLTSAIAGLIMLIFSVFVLRVIGVDIIGIAGF